MFNVNDSIRLPLFKAHDSKQQVYGGKITPMSTKTKTRMSETDLS